MRQRSTYSTGFSLIELMIAMTVTLIVTGAIYGLMTGGQEAFRREPAVTDRQQNIRLAMDIIMRDIASAGGGMPSFIQTFTPGLDGASLGTCVDNKGNTVSCPVGPSGARSDELEILANPEGLDMERACNYPGGSSSTANLLNGSTRLVKGSIGMVLLMDGTWTLRAITGEPKVSSTGADDCKAGEDHVSAPMLPGGDDTKYNLPTGICGGKQLPGPPPDCTRCEYQNEPVPGNSCCSVGVDTDGDGVDDYDACTVKGVLQAELVRYRVRYTDGVPNLERWSSGHESNYGAGGLRVYQVIARGIDELQVEYWNAGGTLSDDAPVVDQSQLDYASLIRTVRVNLSARSEVQNVAGVKTVAVGPAALRGQLTSTATPRAVLGTLGTRVADRKDPNAVSPATWY